MSRGREILSFFVADEESAHRHHHDLLHEEDARGTLQENGNASQVLLAKGVTMAVLCIVSTCMGILPLLLAKWLNWSSSETVSNPRSTKLVGLLLGFGGGVLFSTTFLHLLPEVTEGINDLTAQGKLPPLNFALAEILACTGFFIMYLVEEIVHAHLRRKQANQENIKVDVNRSTNELVENGHTLPPYTNGHSHVNGHGHSHHLPVIMVSDDAANKSDFVISSLRGLLIVLGLSVHELFEGLAIGLESSSSYVWYMFGAVAAHKFVIAFCIGIELLASRTRRYLSVIYICTFAVVSPVGIGIGMLLVGGESAAASGPLAVILQGLATGTLLYVVFFEILQEHRTGLNQYLSILVGFLVMFGMQILTAHSHSHSHGHGHSHESGAEHEHGMENEARSIDEHNHTLADKRLNGSVITEVIERTTESIAEAVSHALSSQTQNSHLHSLRRRAT